MIKEEDLMHPPMMAETSQSTNMAAAYGGIGLQSDRKTMEKEVST